MRHNGLSLETRDAAAEAIAFLAEQLGSQGIRVVVEGGAALLLQGWPVPVVDVDLVIPRDPVELWDALDMLRFLGWPLPPGTWEYAWQHRHVPLRDGPFRADLACADRGDVLRRGRHFDYGRLMREAVRVGRVWCHAWPAVMRGKRERGVVKDRALLAFMASVDFVGPCDRPTVEGERCLA